MLESGQQGHGTPKPRFLRNGNTSNAFADMVGRPSRQPEMPQHF
jgi:hypothetical protein